MAAPLDAPRATLLIAFVASTSERRVEHSPHHPIATFHQRQGKFRAILERRLRFYLDFPIRDKDEEPLFFFENKSAI